MNHRPITLAGFSLLLAIGGAACLKHSPVQCERDENCDLASGGKCLEAASGNQWCAYPSSDCSSSLRYSTQAVGDSLSGQCVSVDVGKGSSCKEQIAFVTGPASPFPDNRVIWIAQADGTIPVKVSQSSSLDDISPSWSPDGQRLMFLSRTEKGYHIVTVNADASERRDLTPGSDSVNMASWSPDGTHIAFLRGGQAWVMNADGTRVQAVSSKAGSFDLAWSPDSKRIVFDIYTVPTSGPGIGERQLYVAPIDASTEPSWLSKDATPNIQELYVSWAPSQRLLWSVMGGDIYTAGPEGQAKVNVTHDTSYKYAWPIYSRDGQRIYFTSNISGYSELWSVAVDGGEKTKVTNNNLAGDVVSYGDQATSVSADGKRVAFRRVGTANNNIAADIGIIDVTRGGQPVLFNAPGSVNASMATFSPCIPQTSLAALSLATQK